MNDTKSKKYESIFLFVITLLLLIPFADKPFHIDDPLFVWTAEHLSNDWIHFYDYDVNWYGISSKMHEIMQNPPLISYIYSIFINNSKIGEVNTHIIAFAFASVLIIGIYNLALQLKAPALLASVLAIVSPVFIVSSTTVMSDIPMLCFATWGVYLWIKGIDEKKILHNIVSVVVISLSVLTKYYGLFSIPIIALYTIIKSGKIEKKTLLIMIPIIVAIIYDLISMKMYGKGLIINAARYAIEQRFVNDVLFNVSASMSFAGGAYIITILMLPWLFKRKEITYLLPVMMAISLIVVLSGWLWNPYKEVSYNNDNILNIHATIFIVNGLLITYLVAREMIIKCNIKNTILGSWILITFIFSIKLNWTINGRTMLPMLPAISILVADIVGARMKRMVGLRKHIVVIPIILALAISISIAMSDYDMAMTNRSVAEKIMSDIGSSRKVYFQGHWGFQYYMEKKGGIPLDLRGTKVKRGDVIITPENNTNIIESRNRNIVEIGRINIETRRWPTVMNTNAMAGFYSYEWGPLPYVYGMKAEEVFTIKCAQ